MQRMQGSPAQQSAGRQATTQQCLQHPQGRCRCRPPLHSRRRKARPSPSLHGDRSHRSRQSQESMCAWNRTWLGSSTRRLRPSSTGRRWRRCRRRGPGRHRLPRRQLEAAGSGSRRRRRRAAGLGGPAPAALRRPHPRHWQRQKLHTQASSACQAETLPVRMAHPACASKEQCLCSLNAATWIAATRIFNSALHPAAGDWRASWQPVDTVGGQQPEGRWGAALLATGTSEVWCSCLLLGYQMSRIKSGQPQHQIVCADLCALL